MTLTEQLRKVFDDFSALKVLILGDVMIDSYYSGKVDRISPEAPVPIVLVTGEENRLGGAANVALNIKALGAKPVLCSVIGDDSRSKTFLSLCEKEGIGVEGIIPSSGRVTTMKTRVIGNNHQLLRVDSEDAGELSETLTGQLVDRAIEIIDRGDIDAVIFEDYDKGVINTNVIDKIVNHALSKNIICTADPKTRNFLNYKNITLFKPNLRELREGSKIDFSKYGDEKFHLAVDKIKNELNAKIILVTLSEDGLYIKSDKKEVKVPTHSRDIADVSGAGDSVISIATLCLALDQSESLIAQLSNLAGGQVCEKVGVVPIEKNQLLKEALSSITAD